MIRLSLYLTILFAIALTASVLSPERGSVVMQVGAYELRTSALALGAVVMILMVIAHMIYALLRYILLSPYRWRTAKSERKYKRSLEEITATLTAIATSDAASARKHLKIATKLLPASALPHILDAQIAGIERDGDKLKAALQHLLVHKSTHTLAHRGLAELHLRQNDLPSATHHAEFALLADPKNQQTGSNLLSLHIRANEWEKAHSLLRNKHYRKSLGRSGCKLLDTKVMIAQAQALRAKGDPHGALDRAEVAHHLSPHFLPATIVLIQLYNTHKRLDAAKKLLLNEWKNHPHRALAALVFTLDMDAFDREKLIEKMAKAYPNNPETLMLKAKLCMAQNQLAQARQLLSAAAEAQKTHKVYRLLADLEQREYGDVKLRDGWLNKAESLPRDATWKCSACGHEHNDWQLHCASCHGFDTLDWK